MQRQAGEEKTKDNELLECEELKSQQKINK